MDRFEIRTGKFGCYFYDVENEKEVTLQEALFILNSSCLEEGVFKKHLELINTPISLDFEDVALQQGKCRLNSRLDADISSEAIKGVVLSVPILSANMSSVTNSNLAILLRKLGGLGVLHRAQPSREVYLEEVEKVAKECDWVAASIGIGEDQYELSKDLICSGANIIVIDIAQGYSQFVIDLGRKIKQEFPHIKIVVGNVINPKFLYEVADYADAVKAGIAGGSACETKNTAGCYQKQFTTILQMSDLAKQLGIPLISDGSIREPSSFVKAIAAGASSVMMGGAIAKCPESAAPMIEIDGIRKKIFSGMASRRVQETWRGKVQNSCPEGKTIYLDIGESLEDLIERYCGALRSGISYVGAFDIESLKRFAKFYRFK